MRRLALFFSGTGGNAANLLAACRDGRVPALPVLGIASSAKAGGILRLEEAGLPVAVVVSTSPVSTLRRSRRSTATCWALRLRFVLLPRSM